MPIARNAAATEAQVFAGGHVLVIGGGNSAGQTAMHLSRFAKEVQVVVRRPHLRDTMSRYLIDQIDATPNIHVRPCTVLRCVEGNGRVESAELVSVDGSGAVVEPVDAVFIMIGARPHTEWLPPEILRDGKGFVLGGRDVSRFTSEDWVWGQDGDEHHLDAFLDFADDVHLDGVLEEVAELLFRVAQRRLCAAALGERGAKRPFQLTAVLDLGGECLGLGIVVAGEGRVGPAAQRGEAFPLRLPDDHVRDGPEDLFILSVPGQFFYLGNQPWNRRLIRQNGRI